MIEQIFILNIKNMEKFDIFDENNIFLWITKDRDIVHRDWVDWHRVTHIWIIDKDYNILCQLRSKTKDSNPGLWQSFFWWHLKAWETYEENSIHELQEELWLNINMSDLIYIYTKKSIQAKHFTNVYVLQYNKWMWDFVFNDNEVDKIEWVSYKKLPEKIEAKKFCNTLDMKVYDFILKNIGNEK